LIVSTEQELNWISGSKWAAPAVFFIPGQ